MLCFDLQLAALSTECCVYVVSDDLQLSALSTEDCVCVVF